MSSVYKYLVVFVLSFSVMQTTSAGNFVEALVCDWHTYSHASVLGENHYMNLYPQGSSAELARDWGIGAGVVLLGTATYLGGVKGLARAAIFSIVAAPVSAYFLHMPATVDDLGKSEYERVRSHPRCRIVRRPINDAQAIRVKEYIAQKVPNSTFNIFKSTCIDFAQGLFDAADIKLNVLQEAHAISPISWKERIETFWMRALMAIKV